MNENNTSRIRVPQLRQESIRYTGMSASFAFQQDIDVEVELGLLNDAQWEYVQRLKTSLRPGAGMSDPANAGMFFTELDTNGDGKVAVDEVPEPMAERFTRLLERGDRDQDKQLSEGEFSTLTRRMAAFESNRPPLAETTQRAQHLLQRSDRNSDGQLSRTEVPRPMSRQFGRFDEDGNGQLEIDELGRAVEILARLRKSAGLPRASAAPAKQRGKNAGDQ
jgi:Ca2+-binding EF-hand superfamily protein